ncbi:hypothetical protein NJ76_31590 [Rhodococcus sp. IITR03]|nr:hypothetical protein NJ76_31590 [Rhodococcus sp. IITR03]
MTRTAPAPSPPTRPPTGSNASRGCRRCCRCPPTGPGRAAVLPRDITRFTVDADLLARLQQLAAARHSTVFMTVHAAFAVLLARLSGSDDIAVGSPVAGRGHRALDDLVGMFVNTVVLRTAVPAHASFTELLAAVTDSDLDAFAHAICPSTGSSTPSPRPARPRTRRCSRSRSNSTPPSCPRWSCRT